MSAFNGATLLITGGTGSFGHTVLKHFLATDIGQIRIFSRDVQMVIPPCLARNYGPAGRAG